MSGYAELHAQSNFSFLLAASHPDELVRQAHALGYTALALTDRNSLAGIVRAYAAAKDLGFKLLVGAEITPVDTPPVVLLAMNRVGYGHLCRLISLGRLRVPKGQCLLWRQDLAEHSEGLVACVLPQPPVRNPEEAASGQRLPFSPALLDRHFYRQLAEEWLPHYRRIFGDRTYLVVEPFYGPDDAGYLRHLVELARAVRIPPVAGGGVRYHHPDRQPLQDVLTAIRLGSPLAEIKEHLQPHAQWHLKSLEEIALRFARYPELVARTEEIAHRCSFCLSELRYDYPEELAPAGMQPMDFLRKLTWEGAARRWPEGIPEKVRQLLEHELRLIEELRYEAYFLTVWDLVSFARSRGILCQGRGSAANSAVCYVLGITSVDPERIDLLFERFVSRQRNEAPDIDVDFEHHRREEVLQYIYRKYGRDRAGMTAEVITYRSRLAVREVGKALGLSLDRVDRLAKQIEHFEYEPELAERCREVGIDPDSPVGAQLVRLATELMGFPRHLSQHTGGMVITRGPLCELVPIENAAMDGRTVIQWNKDDLDELRILKVDCLALGILTAIRWSFDLLEKHYGQKLTLNSIPEEDPAVYAMIQRADTMGVFQIESRAQMAMLPRMKPRSFYDLVIEVAIVRPGPIQGDMVHPYLRRRSGEEPVVYPNEAIRQVLEKTLGVPLFQEQAMRLAIVGAGFTPEEADQLRRAMGAWRRPGLIDQMRERFIRGMLAHGLTPEYAEAAFRQIRGFGEYGFPESHAASFALLVYVSAWIKCHYPEVYTAALLNSQPMGFYAPAQLIQDAQAHGVAVRAVDINASFWETTLEPAGENGISGCSGPVVSVGGVSLAIRPGGKVEDGSLFDLGTVNNGKIARPPRGEHPLRLAPPGELTLSPGGRSLNGQNYPQPTPPVLPGQKHRPFAIRLGFHLVRGLSPAAVERIVAARQQGPFRSVDDFRKRTGLGSGTMRLLAQAGAFSSLGLSRRQSLWECLVPAVSLPLFETKDTDPGLTGENALSANERVSQPTAEVGSHTVPGCPQLAPASLGKEGDRPGSEAGQSCRQFLPPMSAVEEVVADYRMLGLSLRAHPLSFLRQWLTAQKVVPACRLASLPDGAPVKVAGVVLVRQRPATAKGITFVTLEDETGQANLIIRPDVWRKWRKAGLTATLLLAQGRLQKQGEVIHIRVGKLIDLSEKINEFPPMSRDFC
ncbi:MAG: error-prone DNA polymerase [Thermoguttaceae bacterium]|nr:error-prone DNA polymerase [Thermoguttaceae bacterium]